MSRVFFAADLHFGHVHGNPVYETVTSQSFCVSMERIDYKPIEFDAIKKQICDMQKK